MEKNLYILFNKKIIQFLFALATHGVVQIPHNEFFTYHQQATEGMWRPIKPLRSKKTCLSFCRPTYNNREGGRTV